MSPAETGETALGSGGYENRSDRDGDWPGQRRPEVYYAPNALEPGENRGVLHAKLVIADEEAVLVTSANLTEAAFDRNVEAGLLVRDRVVARSAVRQLVGLIERGHLVGWV